MSISLLKQYGNLVKNVSNFTDGQVKISEEITASNSSDSLELVCLMFSPKGGLYNGGTFTFTIALNNFPLEAPEVRCVTQVYHPNIDVEGEVCLNILDELWQSTTTLEDIVQGLLFLFHNPNVDDPLSELFDGGEPYKQYKKNVRKSLKGGTVAGFPFDRNLPEDFVEEKGEEGGEEEEEEDNSDSEDVTECSDSDSEDTEPSTLGLDGLFISKEESNPSIQEEIPEESEESPVLINNPDSSLVHSRVFYVFWTPVRLFRYSVDFVYRVFSLFTLRFAFWTSLLSRTLAATR